jgi:hypothetical protein
MNVKLSHLIFLPIAGSVLLGGYLLTSKPEITLIEKPRTTETVEQTIQKKTPRPTIKHKTDSVYPELTVEQPVIDEASLLANLNKTLIAMNTDESVRLADLNSIAQCPSCLAMLKNHMLTSTLSDQQLTQLVNSLSEASHPEFATLLIETVEKITQQSADDPHEAILINALAQFDSVQVEKDFSSYLVSDRNISKPLQDALINSINESTTNRAQVANELVKQFNDTHDASVREKLLAINHPESLAQISLQALEQDDIELYKQANEQLKSNPSRYTLDALLSMEQMKSANIDQVNQIIDTSYQFAERQLSGNRLDYIEANLAQGGYSEQEKSLVLDILSHSEDKIRRDEIIAKYSN